jgi:polysaccharide deacetylase family protein (PEP-CTERM system associated)
MNFITFDLEDWHQAYALRYGQKNPPVSPYFEKQVDCLLEILDSFSVKATFFCLGRVAIAKKSVIRKIFDAGHKMQIHGHSHDPLTYLTPEAFREDVLKAKHGLEDIIGQGVYGYRAPIFSLTPETSWALRILAELGFQYDSSIYPCQGPTFNWREFPKEPVTLDLGEGLSIVEFPIYSVSCMGVQIPLGGGGYFRLFPFAFINRYLERDDKEDRMFYFHPYEFSKEFLDINDAVKGLPLIAKSKISFCQNLNRLTIPKKVSRLLTSGSFYTIEDYCERKKPESTILFPSYGEAIRCAL